VLRASSPGTSGTGRDRRRQLVRTGGARLEPREAQRACGRIGGHSSPHVSDCMNDFEDIDFQPRDSLAGVEGPGDLIPRPHSSTQWGSKSATSVAAQPEALGKDSCERKLF
jgi:hypothetical protein